MGAISAGTIGAMTGLVLGIESYPPTAWFAALEVGLPAALAGGAAGFVAGLVTRAARVVGADYSAG